MIHPGESLSETCLRIARDAKSASRQLAFSSGDLRNACLHSFARRLTEEKSIAEILEANASDLAEARHLSSAMKDRLKLDEKKLHAMAEAVASVAQFPDPVGQVIEGRVRGDGLEIRKVRVPIGVVLFIYESRPNVTSDAAALCLKSGNAVILRGGKEAFRSNHAIAKQMSTAIAEVGLPSSSVTMLETTDRSAVGELLQLAGEIDLAIPRGGEDLIRRVVAEAKMPVLKHYQGICHIYVESSADLAMALDLVENSKCQRPSTCNAAETLLVDRKIAKTFLPTLAQALHPRGVELRGCEESRMIVPSMKLAEPSDFGKEFLDLILAVRVVADINEAMQHIARHGSGHTETIVTRELSIARRFLNEVDASAVMVNASTRLNDGGELGLGAEIGISTDKFHARGPCGLNELTSYKFQIVGNGHLRG